MDLVQQGTRSREAVPRAHSFGAAFLVAAVMVAVVAVAILATSLIAGSPARIGVGSQVDPLLQPALIEFRRSEHAGAATQVDRLLQPALIEFRRSEHAGAGGP